MSDQEVNASSMFWQGEELTNIGEVTDAALRVAKTEPDLAPLFLAHYTAQLVGTVDDPVVSAVSNLLFIAGHYSEDSTQVIISTYGHPYTARRATRVAT